MTSLIAAYRRSVSSCPRWLKIAALAIACSLSAFTTAGAITLESRPAVSSDDAEEGPSGSVNLTSSDLELVVDGTSTQTVGIRWPAVTIPAGATVTAAYIQFATDEAQSEATNLVIRGLAADNAPTFATTSANVSSRVRTTASVGWAPLGWSTVGQAGANQRTPDLANVIQEIVNRPGWASGNALALVVTGTGHRTAYAVDGSATLAPLLHVEYSTGPPPPDFAPVAGLSVTQNASPFLTVTANGSTSTDTDLTPIASYTFDFGDGSPPVTTQAPTATATHTYAAAGTYTVSLIATDTGSQASTPATADITVAAPPDAPPTARLAVTQTAPLTARADASASRDSTDLTPIASYSFDFGDGSAPVVVSAPTAVATHVYAVAGPYVVTLIVTDTANNSSAPVTAGITVDERVAGSTERRIAASSDDAEEPTGGSVNLSSSDLELIMDSTAQTVGMRWTALAIPAGATIEAAYVQFAAREAQTEVTNLVIRGQAADNPATFTSAAGNVSARARTTASASWSPAAWIANAAGAAQRTTELKSVIQEIVNRPGWASGNALALIVTGTGHRTAFSIDGSAALAPLLHVDFSTGPPPPDFPPVAGLSVAQIASPFLTVTANGSTSTDGDLTPIATYRFDFGDGTTAVTTTAPTATATHTYAAAGPYTVQLIATDTAAQPSSPVTADITVVAPTDVPPTAGLSVTQTAPLTARADASTSTDSTDLTPIASYTFDFGDGTPLETTTAPTAIATHTYAVGGTYLVTLIVTDSGNNASSPVSTNVTVDDRIAGSVERRIAVSSDDAEEPTGSSVNLSSSDLELIMDASAQTVGLRWTGITIPRGATIEAAYVQFAAREAQTEATDLVIRAQAADNPVTFTTAAGNVSTRARTTTSASWAPAAWTANAIGAAQRTSDLKNVIQEIVNRPGWTSGNALALIITGTGHRTAWAIDGQPASAPLLHVDYSVGPPPPENPPVAGLTLTQLASPPLTVTADGSTSTDVDLTPIATYTFNFGDGSPPVTTNAPTATATHTYSDVASYTVTLIATDTGGSPSAPVTADITVTPPPDDPPVAALSVVQNLTPNLTVTADASGSTDTDFTPIASYEFNFGDGTPLVVTTAPVAIATHTYAAPNTYTVTVRAIDTGSQASPPVSVTIAVNAGFPASLERSVAASSDDAEEPAGAAVNVSSGDLELIMDASAQTVGVRFTGINIPKNAAITGAYIQFVAREAQTEATNLVLRGQAIDNAPTFTSTAGNISGRARTSAAANWSPAAWTVDAAGAAQRTSDLKTIIQELVNRSAWVSGNALAIIITGTGHRTAWSFNGLAASAPLLHIDYLSNSPTDDPPVARLSVTQAASPPRTVTADGSASTDGDATPIASYRFTWGDGTADVTTTAPVATASHTYASTGTYTVTLRATDTGGKVSAPVTSTVTVSTASPSNVAVYVGYYDTHHTARARPKPSPWKGSANVTFVGTQDPGTTNGWDSSCIRITNSGSSTLTGVSATVTMGSKNFALWGSYSIPAGQSLILAQTGFENFDGSDSSPAGCYGCNPTLCVTAVSSTKPVVKVTIAGKLTEYIDTDQIMNTKGVDGAGCPYTGTRNDESSNWVQVFPRAAAAMPAWSNPELAGPIARKLDLSSPMPNPSQGDLSFQFSVPSRGDVRLGVYDIMGRQVRGYLDEVLEPGDYRGALKLNGMAPGMYFLGLRSTAGNINKAFVLIR